MLDNIRRKFSNPSIKDFYDRCLECGKFGDLMYYEGMIYSISAERGMKKTSDRSFKPFHKSSKDLSLNGIHMEMIPCPAGKFIMGHKDQGDNQPRQEVIERPFLLGETEVTQGLYQAVMDINPSRFDTDPQNPVEQVSWFDAILFCNELSKLQGLDKCYILTDISTIDKEGVDQERIMSAKVICGFGKSGYRLPTEKEWEYAAKAGTQNKYAGTDNVYELEDYAWFSERKEYVDDYDNYAEYEDDGSTYPVKIKKPNEWGFYDMSGNVSEWCWDMYDPDNPDTSDDRVVRGGGWDGYAPALRSALRSYGSPGLRFDSVGFRVCRSIVN